MRPVGAGAPPLRRCDGPGGPEVDSLDELAERRNTLLNASEQLEVGPTQDPAENDRIWTDSDGDGSVCDSGERGENGDGSALPFVTLLVFANRAEG